MVEATGGVTATAAKAELDTGSVVTMKDGGGLFLSDIFLGATGGSPSFVDVGNGATVNLNAAGLGSATDVITANAGSFINFTNPSTGAVFIDNISLAQVEALIAAGKFGVGRIAYTNPARFILTVDGAGVTVQEGDPVGIAWTGASGDWSDTANWSGGTVPAIGGTDSATISSGTATRATDLTFSNQSDLILDGGTYHQTAGQLTFANGSAFAISNGGSLVSSGYVLFDNNGFAGAANTIDDSSMTVDDMRIHEGATLTLTNGSTLTVAQPMEVKWGSYIALYNSTMTAPRVQLDSATTANWIDIGDDASLNLNASGWGTDVIYIGTSPSFVNFTADSTGTVFIDNISLAEVQTMIGQGKFGIDRVLNTDLASYTLSTQGAGVRIQLAVVLPATPILTVVGFDGAGDFVMSASLLDPATTYQLKLSTDLQTFVPLVPPVVIDGSLGAQQQVKDENPPAGKAFYRLETP
jgi:hypothetical protein